MRKLIATVFNYSLDGLLADEGTEFWKFCFDLPEIREPDDPAQLDFLQSAYAHIMGRTAYEAIAGSMTTSTDHPFAPILNAARKVVFSRTLKTADWANTTIAAGDTAEEIDKLRLGGDGHIVVWGGVSLWRSLMRLDLIDEFRLDLYPHVAGEGTRLFDGSPEAWDRGAVGLPGRARTVACAKGAVNRPHPVLSSAQTEGSSTGGYDYRRLEFSGKSLGNPRPHPVVGFVEVADGIPGADELIEGLSD